MRALKTVFLAGCVVLGWIESAEAATVYVHAMRQSTATCNANRVCPLPGGSACTGSFPGTCTGGGFDTNWSNSYRDDLPVYTLSPDPNTVDPHTGNKDMQSNNRLLVFLHGTGGGGNSDAGVGHKNFLHTAAHFGFHVVTLDYYESQEPPRSNCGCNTYCYGYLRNKQFDGSSYSLTGSSKPLHYDMHPNESVASRLLAVVTWLNANKPTQSWGTFLSGGQIKWSTVVMSGHSQGSGLAAFAGKRKSLAGVFMFSGIMDSVNESGEKDQYSHLACRTSSPRNSVPNWVSDNHFGGHPGSTWATSDIMKYWGLRGTRDTNTTNADCTSAVKQNWDAMALSTAHFPSEPSDGYGTVDLQGVGGNDYVAKGRRGLYIGSATANSFSSCLDGAGGNGTPVVSPIAAAASETCEAGHSSTEGGDIKGMCNDGTTFHGTYGKLNEAWSVILTAPF